MAVQVPRIERANVTSGMPKNDRINMNVKDQASNILQRGNALAGVVEKADEVHTAVQNEKIDQMSYENEKDYTIWTNDQLNKLKSVEGDPTKAYKDFEESAVKKKEDLLALYPEADGRVKESISARLSKTHDSVNIAVLKQRGMQQEVYANNLYESTVKLKKDTLPVVAGYITKDDPSSFQMFDQGMADIKTIIAKRGLNKGTSERLPDDAKGANHAYLDDDGKMVKIKMTPLDQQRVAKEVSSGVKSSMEALIASGQIEEARMMQEKYKVYIDPKTATSLEKKFKTVGRKAEAYEIIGGLKGKPEDVKLEEIDEIEDPELRSEALKILDANTRHITLIRERADKANRDVLLKEAGTGKYESMVDFENSPTYKAIDFDNLSAKSQKSIRESIEQPKESSPKAQAKLSNLFLGDNDALENMSDSDFQTEYLVGLSKSERTKALKDFNRLKHPGAAEERATLTRGDTLLKKHLIMADHIDNNGDDEDERILYRNQEKMRKYVSTLKVAPSDERLEKIAKEFAAAEVEDRVFKSENVFGKKKQAPKTAKGAGQSKSPASTISPKGTLRSGIDIPGMKVKFKNEYGFLPFSGDDRFIKFANEYKG